MPRFSDEVPEIQQLFVLQEVCEIKNERYSDKLNYLAGRHLDHPLVLFYQLMHSYQAGDTDSGVIFLERINILTNDNPAVLYVKGMLILKNYAPIWEGESQEQRLARAYTFIEEAVNQGYSPAAVELADRALSDPHQSMADAVAWLENAQDFYGARIKLAELYFDHTFHGHTGQSRMAEVIGLIQSVTNDDLFYIRAKVSHYNSFKAIMEKQRAKIDGYIQFAIEDSENYYRELGRQLDPKQPDNLQKEQELQQAKRLGSRAALEILERLKMHVFYYEGDDLKNITNNVFRTSITAAETGSTRNPAESIEKICQEFCRGTYHLEGESLTGKTDKQIQDRVKEKWSISDDGFLAMANTIIQELASPFNHLFFMSLLDLGYVSRYKGGEGGQQHYTNIYYDAEKRLVTVYMTMGRMIVCESSDLSEDETDNTDLPIQVVAKWSLQLSPVSIQRAQIKLASMTLYVEGENYCRLLNDVLNGVPLNESYKAFLGNKDAVIKDNLFLQIKQASVILELVLYLNGILNKDLGSAKRKLELIADIMANHSSTPLEKIQLIENVMARNSAQSIAEVLAKIESFNQDELMAIFSQALENFNVDCVDIIRRAVYLRMLSRLPKDITPYINAKLPLPPYRASRLEQYLFSEEEQRQMADSFLALLHVRMVREVMSKDISHQYDRATVYLSKIMKIYAHAKIMFRQEFTMEDDAGRLVDMASLVNIKKLQNQYQGDIDEGNLRSLIQVSTASKRDAYAPSTLVWASAQLIHLQYQKLLTDSFVKSDLLCFANEIYRLFVPLTPAQLAVTVVDDNAPVQLLINDCRSRFLQKTSDLSGFLCGVINDAVTLKADQNDTHELLKCLTSVSHEKDRTQTNVLVVFLQSIIEKIKRMDTLINQTSEKQNLQAEKVFFELVFFRVALFLGRHLQTMAQSEAPEYRAAPRPPLRNVVKGAVGALSSSFGMLTRRPNRTVTSSSTSSSTLAEQVAEQSPLAKLSLHGSSSQLTARSVCIADPTEEANGTDVASNTTTKSYT